MASPSSPQVAARESSNDAIELPAIGEDDLQLDENADEETRLKLLTTAARDQDDVERDINRQADELLIQQADEQDKKRADKVALDIKRHEVAIDKLRARLFSTVGEPARAKVHAEMEELRRKIDGCEQEIGRIQERIDARHAAQIGEDTSADGVNKFLPNETRREFLIRTGKITPFAKLGQQRPAVSTLANTMLDAEMDEVVAAEEATGPISHRNLLEPGFEDVDSASEVSSLASARKTESRHIEEQSQSTPDRDSGFESPIAESDDAYSPGIDDRELAALGDSHDESEVGSEDGDYEEGAPGRKRKRTAKAQRRTKVKKPTTTTEEAERDDLAGVDDGNEKVYRTRVVSWEKNRAAARRRAREKQGLEPEEPTDEEEAYRPHPTRPDAELAEGFRIPGDIYPSLFDYQKTGVQWLWELYSQNVGGIVGDEMGLGKTVQAITMIAGLHYSKKLTRPVIVVCPATVMKQWVNEFHRWWPPLRVSILHTSGSGMLDTRREDRLERDMELRRWGVEDDTLNNRGRAAKQIVHKVLRDGHVLVTTYSGLQTYAEFLVPVNWQYAILDEGHKIRNPNTRITIHCKQLRTANRIILSGTPIQNNLTELWSLFDFVFPMRLGTLMDFKRQFEFPIKQGGYANASNLAFETAKSCAETLKDAISPYLLQRYKVDVAADLPQKKEQILFCKLTKPQRDAYQMFLKSGEMESILAGKRQMLYGVDWLRKICNHPDLLEHKSLVKRNRADYGTSSLSGKMQVVKELLRIWKKGGHKALLFAQQRIMLDILEKFVKGIPDLSYRRMDGETPIKRRQDLVDEFNNDPTIDVFLLTTKVGGLGVNLTGADRVIIYDPDWNPSTDAQARERSWRLGQKREVEIYRLMTAGTIEEKIYHRQIFKQFLTNKVLKDPSQRQTFQMNDLYDLFSFGNEPRRGGKTETGELFRGAEIKIDPQSQSQSVEEEKDIKSIASVHHAEAIKANESEATSGAGSPSATSEATTDNNKSDDRLLSSIFARSGVHAAIEHDKVMTQTRGGKRKIVEDPAWVQKEAKREAEKVAKELKEFEARARNAPVGVPTWTGEAGEAGRPPPAPTPVIRGGLGSGMSRGAGRGGRGGALSSSSVLANLAARQGRANSPSLSSYPSSRSGTPTPNADSNPPRGRRMLEMIRDFLQVHNGVVYTQMLINHFDRYCRAPGAEAEFKELLKAVATFERGGGGRGRWRLKEEWMGSRRRGAG